MDVITLFMAKRSQARHYHSKTPQQILQLCISTEGFSSFPTFYTRHINSLQNQPVGFSAWFLWSWLVHYEYVITKIRQKNTITKYFSLFEHTFHQMEQAETISCGFPHLSIWTEQASCFDSSCCSLLNGCRVGNIFRRQDYICIH